MSNVSPRFILRGFFRLFLLEAENRVLNPPQAVILSCCACRTTTGLVWSASVCGKKIINSAF